MLNADPEQKYWVFDPTDHRHHSALTGHENGEVTFKSERYHSLMKKDQGYQRRWLQSQTLHPYGSTVLLFMEK